MRQKEYLYYMQKRNAIITKLNDEKVDLLILENLKEHGLKIRNKNANYIVELVKKVLYDYDIMGKEKTLEIINGDNDHIHINMESRQINTKKMEKLSNSKTKVRLPYDSIHSNAFNSFIVSIADDVNNKLNEDKKMLTYNNI